MHTRAHGACADVAQMVRKQTDYAGVSYDGGLARDRHPQAARHRHLQESPWPI